MNEVTGSAWQPSPRQTSSPPSCATRYAWLRTAFAAAGEHLAKTHDLQPCERVSSSSMKPPPPKGLLEDEEWDEVAMGSCAALMAACSLTHDLDQPAHRRHRRGKEARRPGPAS